MYKIFTTGNYFFIIDLVTNIEYEGLKKDVRVRRLQTNTTAFYFDNVNSWKDTVSGIDISNIQKEDGSAYTISEFLDFRNYETGNYGIATPTSTPTLATKIPMINENGVFVWQNTMSDGTITYTLQDGTAYAGDVTLLLPYSAGTHKVADFSITTFAVSGAFDYLKTKLEHGFSLIQSIEIGEGQTFNAFTNYNILPNGDLVISTNSAFPNTNFVRITGIQ